MRQSFHSLHRAAGAVVLALLTGVLAAAAPGAEAPSVALKLPRAAGQALALPPLDEDKVARETLFETKGQPTRYAITHRVSVDAGSSAYGQWSDAGRGLKLWRLRVEAPNALSIDVAFKPFRLPKGAALYLTSADGRFVRGPYTAADNPASGEFWTPFVPGDVAYVEVMVPAKSVDALELELFNVNQAFRDLFTGTGPYEKSGSCNVDVVCPQGDTHREQIRAVARYSANGGLCTGQLINNTANDGRRLFITANHCLSSQGAANSVVAYWNYENPTCRTPGSGASGTPIPVSGNSIAHTGGALLRATHQPSDTTLLEFNNAIPAAVTPYWDGWDRSDTAKASAVVIHHPQGDEKRISFENNPLVLSDTAVQGVPGSRHWRVNDWDLGTTEQGSSGSGLLSPEKRLIGVLSGGGAACGNNLEDYFGRLGVAWDGGGSAATRVRDWLDPGNSGVTTIAGRGACTPPAVAVTSSTASPSVDAPITFTATMTGGTAPYTVRWDVDADGVIDRVTTTNTNTASIPVRFPVASTLAISATAADAGNCPGIGTLALEISAPDIAVHAGARTQVCGDGDNVIEPGERWSVPVTLTNVGGNGLNNARAQFSRVPDDAIGGDVPRDTFGNRVYGSATASATCRYQPVDMSGSTVVVPDDNDDGISDALDVGGATPFRLYGQSVSQVYMSTNGYLATSSQDDGGDYENTCGLYGSTFGSNARLHALHDDLVIQSGGSLRYQRFATCPRAADAGGAQGCTVFQWNNLGRYTQGSPPQGNAVFQAILYDTSYEIVYQYLTADALAGGGATISIENAARTDGLVFGCDQPNQAASGRAVCFFEPSALPASGVSAAAVSFEGQAQQVLPDLASSQAVVVNVPFAVPADTACGTQVAVQYVGTVDDFSSSMRTTTVVNEAIGSGGNCAATSACPIATTPLAGIPRDGLYWNPNRSGNGIGMFNIPVGDSAVMAGTWFSGRADRLPTWYLLNGAWNARDRLADLTLFEFAQPAPGVFPAIGTEVGSGVLTHDGAGDDYVMSWRIGGIQRMDKLQRTFADTNVGQTNHTGLWNTEGQTGWGMLIDDHAFGATVDSYMVDYLFDATGRPTWTLGSANNLSGTMPQQVYQVHCPWCPNITDFASTTQVAAGSQTRTFTGANAGLFGSTIEVPSTNTTWNRSNLPIRLLTVPLQ